MIMKWRWNARCESLDSHICEFIIHTTVGLDRDGRGHTKVRIGNADVVITTGYLIGA